MVHTVKLRSVMVNRVVESKLSEILKGQVTLNHKAVSAEEFNKMFQ